MIKKLQVESGASVIESGATVIAQCIRHHKLASYFVLRVFLLPLAFLAMLNRFLQRLDIKS